MIEIVIQGYIYINFGDINLSKTNLFAEHIDCKK